MEKLIRETQRKHDSRQRFWELEVLPKNTSNLLISDGQYPKNTKKYQELLKDKPQPKSNYDFIINLSGKHLIQLIQQSKRYLY